MSRRTSASDVIDKLLVALASTGTIGLSVIAPNSLSALEKPLERFIAGKDKRREAQRLARYMKQQKIVSVTKGKDNTYLVSIGKNGVTRTKKAQFEQLKIPKEKWDKKWRVITFDIPEKHKTIRDYISRHLRIVGFKQLQRSVFVYPYPVDEFVVLLRNLFPEIDDNLSYMTVEEIDVHNKLVHLFKDIL